LTPCRESRGRLWTGSGGAGGSLGGATSLGGAGGSSKRDAGQAGTTGTPARRGRLHQFAFAAKSDSDPNYTSGVGVLTATEPHVQWVCGPDSTTAASQIAARSPWSIASTCNTSTRSRQEEWQRHTPAHGPLAMFGNLHRWRCCCADWRDRDHLQCRDWRRQLFILRRVPGVSSTRT